MQLISGSSAPVLLNVSQLEKCGPSQKASPPYEGKQRDYAAFGGEVVAQNKCLLQADFDAFLVGLQAACYIAQWDELTSM
jgi:hypothetical protein